MCQPPKLESMEGAASISRLWGMGIDGLLCARECVPRMSVRSSSLMLFHESLRGTLCSQQRMYAAASTTIMHAAGGFVRRHNCDKTSVLSAACATTSLLWCSRSSSDDSTARQRHTDNASTSDRTATTLPYLNPQPLNRIGL